MKKNIVANNNDTINNSNTNNSIEAIKKGLAYTKSLSLSQEQIQELPKEDQELIHAIQTANDGIEYCGLSLRENEDGPKYFRIRSRNLRLMLHKFPSEEKAKYVAEQLIPEGEFFDVIEDDSNKTFRIVRDGNIPVNETVYRNRQDACLDLIAIANPELHAKAKAFAES